MTRTIWPVMATAAGAVTVLAAGCTFEINTDDTVTERFDVADFTAVDIGHAFDATIVVGEETEVEIEIDEELLDRLDVRVEDERLVVGFTGGLVSTSGTMDIMIHTPTLTGLHAGGAADVSIDGLDAETFELTADGATDVDASGTIGDLTLDVDGASTVDLDDVDVTTATVDVDGASSVDLDNAASVTGSIGGASSLDVSDDADVDVATGGGATLD